MSAATSPTGRGGTPVSPQGARIASFLALYALTLAAGPASAADRRVRLHQPPPIRKDLPALPRIADPVDAAQRRINAALDRLDAATRTSLRECAGLRGKKGKQVGWWERTVAVAMRGPRFLSITLNENAYCSGGAHPSYDARALVYDLGTGKPVDWAALLPPDLTGDIKPASPADGSGQVSLASARLHALYLERYRPPEPGEKPDAGDEECREAVRTAGGDRPPAMTVWPVGREGLSVQFDLPHAVNACADAVVIPTSVLRAQGASATLMDAIDAPARPRRSR